MPSFKENLQKPYRKREGLKQFYIQSVSTKQTLIGILTHNEPNTVSAYAFLLGKIMHLPTESHVYKN